MYEVYLERSAENDLKRLPTTTFHRIIPKIKTLAENPRPSGCRKIAGSRNDWRITLAQRAFLDPHRVIAEDTTHSGKEERLYCIGRVGDGIVTVRFTYRGNVIRIYGAGYWRKGRKIYEEQNKIC